MAAAGVGASTVFAIKIAKCSHFKGTNFMRCLEHRRTLIEVFEEEHGVLNKTSVLNVECVMGSGTEVYDVAPNMTIGDIKDMTKQLHFKCTESVSEHDIVTKMVNTAAEAATKQTVDAFQILMAGGRQFVKTKTSR